MTVPVVLDAGPALNFFSTKNERLLLSLVGARISAPETVRDEVRDKGSTDRRFTAAPTVWTKLEAAGRLHVLSDSVTPELSNATERITGVPLAVRKTQAKDLGETMVVAHAAVLAEAGHDVTVLIDDGPGTTMATREIRRLQRRKPDHPAWGTITLINTPAVLTAAIRTPYIPDKGAMRRTYEALRRCDDGLVHIEQTILLSHTRWDS